MNKSHLSKTHRTIYALRLRVILIGLLTGLYNKMGQRQFVLSMNWPNCRCPMRQKQDIEMLSENLFPDGG